MPSSTEPVAKWRVGVALILWAVFVAALGIYADGKDFTAYGVLYLLCAAVASAIILIFAFCFESYSLSWRIVIPVLVVAVFILAAMLAVTMNLPLIEPEVNPIIDGAYYTP